MTYVKPVGVVKRHESWVSEVVLERDDDGVVTKSVQIGVPVDLTKEEQERVEELGIVLEESSASEAKKVKKARAEVAGADVTGTAPVFGSETSGQQPSTNQTKS